jgi:phage protein D
MTPTFLVTADGSNITAALKQRLLSLVVREEINHEAGAARGTSHTCDIELDDRDGAIAMPAMGALLVVEMGYQETGRSKMGEFRVDEVELEGPERRLLIRAHAADTNAKTTLPQILGNVTRSWPASTVGAVAATIAGLHGWSSVVASDIASIATPERKQTGQDDMGFLKTVVAETSPGAYCTLAGGIIVIAYVASGTTASGAALPSISVGVTDVLGWHMTKTVRCAHSTVKANYYDYDSAETSEATATGADEETSSTEEPLLYQSEAIATAAAGSRLAALQSGVETLEATLIGNSAISAGARLAVSGIRSGVDGTWIITRAEHRISGQGYSTEVEAVKS